MTLRIAALVAQHRLPAIAEVRRYSEQGLLPTYSPDFADVFRRAAHYVVRIFNGSKPAELPVERATKFNLVIDLKTAKALGLRIPQSRLVRADQVIN